MFRGAKNSKLFSIQGLPDFIEILLFIHRYLVYGLKNENLYMHIID